VTLSDLQDHFYCKPFRTAVQQLTRLQLLMTAVAELIVNIVIYATDIELYKFFCKILLRKSFLVFLLCISDIINNDFIICPMLYAIAMGR